MSAEQTSTGSGLKTFLAGAAIGAGIALLYAPQAGKETRKYLGKKAKALKDKAQGAVENAQEFINDHKGDVAAALHAGKEVADHVKHRR